MSRKVLTLVLSICMVFSCVVTIPAAEPEDIRRAALEPTEAMAPDAYDVPLAQVDDDQQQLADSIQQLRMDLELVCKQARNAAVTAAAAKTVLVDQYGGVMVTSDSAVFYKEMDDEAGQIRTITRGKVARLLDTAGDWYRVSFDNCTGYLKSAETLPVCYADYEGTAATSMLIDDVIAYAYTYLGTPYVYGGSSRNGIDCSAFTQQVFNHFGFNLPRTVSAQYRVCRRVSDSERRPGDLLFFNTSGGLSHIGIYLGNGQFIHAGSIYGVSIRSLSESYFAGTYLFAGRVIN